MGKKKIFTLLIGITVIALLVTLGLFVRVTPAADQVAVLKTTGMTCSSCSGKINDALRSLKGVAVTEVDVAGGWVIVGYEQKSVKPEVLAEKVSKAGFASAVHMVLTPEQFKQITGRDIGKKANASRGCCPNGGGCGSDNKTTKGRK